MDNNSKNMMMALWSDKIAAEDKPVLSGMLDKVDESKKDILSSLPLKSPMTTLLLSILVGSFGVDRFYLGEIGLGITKLFIGWITCGIWYIIDIFLCHKKAKKMNLEKIRLTIQSL